MAKGARDQGDEKYASYLTPICQSRSPGEPLANPMDMYRLTCVNLIGSITRSVTVREEYMPAIGSDA